MLLYYPCDKISNSYYKTMALTPSNMLPLGTKAPDFNLVDTKDNQKKSLNQPER